MIRRDYDRNFVSAALADDYIIFCLYDFFSSLSLACAISQVYSSDLYLRMSIVTKYCYFCRRNMVDLVTSYCALYRIFGRL